MKNLKDELDIKHFMEIINEVVSRGYENLKEFKTYFPFKSDPSSIDSLTSEEVYNKGNKTGKSYFFYWVEHKTGGLGGLKVSPRGVHPYEDASDKLEIFKDLLKRLMDPNVSVVDKLDDKWEQLSGFGRQRQIAKKILYLYHEEDFIPIWKTEDLEDYCKDLGLIELDDIYKSKDDIQKFIFLNNRLLEFRKLNYPSMDNASFMYALYGFIDKYVKYYKNEINIEFRKTIKMEIKRRENTFGLIKFLLSTGAINNYDKLVDLWWMTIPPERLKDETKIKTIEKNLNLSDEDLAEAKKFFNNRVGSWGTGKFILLMKDATNKVEFYDATIDILISMINPEVTRELVEEKIQFLIDNIDYKNVRSGNMSPLFHCCRPRDFGIINAPERKVWDEITSAKDSKYSPELRDYLRQNDLLRNVTRKYRISLNELDILVWKYVELREDRLGLFTKKIGGPVTEPGGPKGNFEIKTDKGKRSLKFLRKNMDIYLK